MHTNPPTRLAAVFAFLIAGHGTGSFAQDAAASAASDTPCMGVLGRFTAPGVPTTGPAETESPVGKWTNGVTPPNLPGNGLARHAMLYTGENYTKMFLVAGGKVVWTYSTGPGFEYDDQWMLSNGNVLFTRMQYVALVTPDKRVLWRYDAPKGTEVHSCQPIDADRVVLVRNGVPPKIMVINTKTGRTEVEHEVPFENAAKNVHGQFRRIRYTAAGTYLLSFLTLNKVVEYDKDFNEIWRYDIKSPWAAIRLKNGNTLITDESDRLTREVNPKGETVWEFKATDLPEAYRFTTAPQTCTRLANGNTIFCSRGTSDGRGPQLVEVTPDKQVVWVLQDWKTLGGATAVQVLDDPGVPEVPGESQH